MLNYTDKGELSYEQLWFFKNNFYQVLDTDYTTYAIVYECTSNSKVLNYSNDDVHVFTRSETASTSLL